MDGYGTQRVDTVVIGGGQAGLAIGYHLRKQGRPFVILDGEARVGDPWRRRWDSLLLFTPARYASLPGGHFPGPGSRFPTKDEMADYLESYATRFSLPVVNGAFVDRLWREGDRFVVSAGGRLFEADNVVVATGANRLPRTPAFADQLDPEIVQFHSAAYRHPSQLRDGDVLVVGAGNSGADISIEVARAHRTWLSGSEVAHVPFRIETWVARNVLVRLVRFVGVHVLTLRTPIGRKARRGFEAGGTIVVRVKPKDIAAAGITRVPKVTGVRDGSPVLEDGQVLDVANVIWCTGFRQDFSWIDLPIFDESGAVAHERGVVPAEPGLFFLGLPFQFAAASDTLPGMGRDAAYVAKRLARSKRREVSARTEPLRASTR
jgi:putative flavoprotein involved in K+ transport